MNINYDHAKNRHTLKGPLAALPLIFPKGIPKRILDIGCGTGTWLRATKELGAEKVLGIDGVDIPRDQLLIDSKDFQRKDLTKPIKTGQKFDAVFCLEVAEHLEKKHADTLIKTLTRHSNTVYFSAACPGQPGQNHVNCQWPEFWQKRFNRYGFVCQDILRQKLWPIPEVESWYKQNIFLAFYNKKKAGFEPRIEKLIHPDIARLMGEKTLIAACSAKKMFEEDIKKGRLKCTWYFKSIIFALFHKLKNKWI